MQQKLDLKTEPDQIFNLLKLIACSYLKIPEAEMFYFYIKLRGEEAC